MYSIEKELQFLRLFVSKEYTEDKKCYSETEIQAVENRLRYKLPAPIRQLYQYMGDILVNSYYVKPLELLHWENNCLGFFISPETDMIIGVCKDENPNFLFEWENGDYKDNACDYLGDIEEAYEEEDFPKIQPAIDAYLAYWDEHRESPAFSAKRLNHNLRYVSLLDAYCIFLSAHAICEWAEISGRNYFTTSDICFEPDRLEQQNALNSKILQSFAPLSTHTELLEKGTPILMAYKHENPNALLVLMEDDIALTLLTTQEPEKSFIANFENQTGLQIIQHDHQCL